MLFKADGQEFAATAAARWADLAPSERHGLLGLRWRAKEDPRRNRIM